MTVFTIIVAFFVAAVLIIVLDRILRQYCRHCGTKMNRYFDPEEDAEVYQCPTCGRSYIIK